VFELSLKIADRDAAGDEDFDRNITLSDTSRILVGRASKTENKALVPTASNAWIRNPVISRTHAELTVSNFLGTPCVHIQDLKSSHGTFVNGQNIKDRKQLLKTNDRLQFGANVMRGTGESLLHPSLLSSLSCLHYTSRSCSSLVLQGRFAKLPNYPASPAADLVSHRNVPPSNL
jgi:hypothetical protein